MQYDICIPYYLNKEIMQYDICIPYYLNREIMQYDIFQHVNGSVCVECLDVYKALKSKFKVAMEISNEEVCMDLVDMVGKFSYRCILVLIYCGIMKRKFKQ